MRRRLIGVTAVLVAVVALAAAPWAGARTVEAAARVPMDSVRFLDHGVEVANVSAAAGDTAKVFARWGAAVPTDGVPVDGYQVRWTVSRGTSGFPATRTVTALVDQVLVPLPALPDSACVTATVWATRQGRLSADSVQGSRCFKKPLGPPPAPGPVILDTLAVQFDSVMVLAARASVQAGDTVTACAAGRQRGTTTWVLATPAAVIRTAATGAYTVTAVPLPTTECGFLTARRTVATNTYVPAAWRVDTLVSGGGGGGEFSARRYQLRAVPGGRWRTAAPVHAVSEE